MNKTNLKKILLILLFIVVIFVIAYFIYTIFFKQKNIPIIPIEPTGQQGTLPTIGPGDVNTQVGGPGTTITGQFNDIINENVVVDKIAKGGFVESNLLISQNIELGFFNKTNNGINYYDRNKQAFFTISSDGKVKRLSDNKFISVDNVSWSSNGNKAIMTYPDRSNVLYDFEKDRQIATLPSDMRDFIFSPVNDQISAKWVDSNNRTEFNYVTVSDSNGANMQFVEPIGEKAADVQSVWSPDNEIVATYREYYDGERQEIFFINPNNKNLKSLTVDGRGFEVEWSPKGDKILYNVFSSYSNFSPTLWLADGYGNELGYGKMPVNLNTWVDKCDFSKSDEQIVYCAVPDYLPEGSGWYKELAKDIPYSIYKINILNGRKELIAQPIVNNERVSVGKIYSNKGDDKIYYTDESSGYLYDINLK